MCYQSWRVCNVAGQYVCEMPGQPGDPVLYARTLEEMEAALRKLGMEVCEGGKVIRIRVERHD